MQAKRYHAFISHNSKDKPQVRRIVNELFSYFSIWFDQADMLYTDKGWDEQITQGLQASDVCVVFVGKNGLGPSQKKEIQIAKDLKIRICCAFLPGAVPEKINEQLQISNTQMYSNYMEGESRIAFESLAAGILGRPIGWEFLIGVKLQKRAEEWVSKKNRTLLYKGDELQQAKSWKKKHSDEIGNLELAFLKASLDAQKARIAGWVIASTFLLCIISSLAIFGATRQPAVNAANTQSAIQGAAAQSANATANAEQERADEQNKIARAGQLADQADVLREQNPIVSFLLSVEAYNMFENAQTYSVLRKNVHAFPQILRFVNGTNYFESGRVTDDGMEHSFGPGDDIDTVAFSPDGKMIAFVVRDKIILQNVYSGDELQVVSLPPRNAEGDDNYAYGLIFSTDSKTIISDNAQGDVLVWDIESGLVKQRLVGHENSALVRDLAISSDGQILASSSQNDDKLIIWDVSTGNILCNVSIYTEAVGLSFIPDTQKLITNRFVGLPLDDFSSEIEDNILIWDVSTCTSSVFFIGQQTGRILNITPSLKGEVVALENLEHDIVVWDVLANQPLFTISHEKHPLSPNGKESLRPTKMALSLEGKRLAIGYEDGRILIWNLETQELDHELKFGSDRVRILVFGMNENILISNNVLWDLSQSQNNDFILTGHTEGVYGVAFSPDGNLLASAGQDTNVIVWDMATKQMLCLLEGHPNAVESVYFTSDNTIVSSDMRSSDTDSITITWNLLDLCPNITANRKPVSQSEVSDIPLFLERRSDGLWIVNSNSEPIGSPLMGLPSSSTRIEVYIFNRNNSLLATGGSDGSLMLWNVANSRLLSALLGHSDVVRALDFSPDNKILASASSDGTIRLWDIDINNWLLKLCQITGRNFTIEEWNLYFPGEDYRTTCPQWIVGK